MRVRISPIALDFSSIGLSSFVIVERRNWGKPRSRCGQNTRRGET
ncbi:hypothetical protein MANES_14G116221v8 [Manihot esculenta]|uniref:Uncharacterized protein n=1 Tax=Manihot esculenta TaxID=3983 RepID=A0ACB7GHV4_MANES|nr:hypothetical protein MANES_14G116221v8 [Manihot esculenta]